MKNEGNLTGNEQINRMKWTVIYLAGCALHDIPPREERIADVDLESLYRISRFHSMTAVMCMALEKTSVFDSAAPELKKKWQDAKNKAIRKNMLLDAERAQLFTWMEQKGIWYMPLKGIVLKDLYPKLGMRQMADNDILFDASRQYEIRDYMKARGYKAVSVGKGCHDVYEKPPVYNFELHTALFGNNHNPLWVFYYADVKKWLLKDAGNAYGYHFREEDFYIYMVTHACKHYGGSGTGLRSLMDTYVYIWRKDSCLDWDYIGRETEKLGVSEFERRCRILSEKLFRNPDKICKMKLSEEEEAMLSEFGCSGTYGTQERRIRKSLEKLQSGRGNTGEVKWRYCLQRLFPDKEFMKNNYPGFSRFPLLMPLGYIYRIFVKGIGNWKKLWREIRRLREL